MIKINNDLVKVSHFPDGTQYINFQNVSLEYNPAKPNTIYWFYDSDEELFTLASAVNFIRRNTNQYQELNLQMPYVPNARMDRIKSFDENFSLQVFANLINSFGFSMVGTNNVHSNVSEALINNIVNIDDSFHIYRAITQYKPDVIFFPDEGACKRYSDSEAIKRADLPIAFGIKKRDWKTGQILGLDVISDTDLTDKKVLIVDDICSAGGTFKFSSIKLKEMGAKDVALFVSHCEDNIQNGDLLKTDLISTIYTTDSILHIEDEKINLVWTYRK